MASLVFMNSLPPGEDVPLHITNCSVRQKKPFWVFVGFIFARGHLPAGAVRNAGLCLSHSWLSLTCTFEEVALILVVVLSLDTAWVLSLRSQGVSAFSEHQTSFQRWPQRWCPGFTLLIHRGPQASLQWLQMSFHLSETLFSKGSPPHLYSHRDQETIQLLPWSVRPFTSIPPKGISKDDVYRGILPGPKGMFEKTFTRSYSCSWKCIGLCYVSFLEKRHF